MNCTISKIIFLLLLATRSVVVEDDCKSDITGNLSTITISGNN